MIVAFRSGRKYTPNKPWKKRGKSFYLSAPHPPSFKRYMARQLPKVILLQQTAGNWHQM
jgi:hypothetical protein